MEYETLVKAQELETRRLLEFCELPWEEDCLKFYKGSKAVSTASNMQVKQKIYTKAVDGWQRYQDYLGPVMDLVENPNSAS